MAPVRQALGAKSNHRSARKKGDRPVGNTPPMRLLVIVDATDGSQRVIRYVARVAAGRKAIEIRLAHLEPGLPPALLETGGAEQPEREAQIEADLRASQHAFIAAAGRQSARLLQRARRTLEHAGVSVRRIQICHASSAEALSAADAVLWLARDAGCETVVVGHRKHGWLQTLGNGDLADQLARKAAGLAVWIVT